MAKTITISLPDDLHARFQVVKSEFNVSKVCQEAIEKKVELLESAKSDDLLTFLGKGKKMSLADGNKLGRKSALECINNKGISYSEFERIYTWCNDNPGSLTAPDAEFVLRGDNNEGITVADLADEHYVFHRDNGVKMNMDSFFIGFVEGILEFWETVKDKI